MTIYDFKLSQAEIDKIEEHCTFLLESANHALERLKSVYDWQSSDFCVKQVRYWENVSSGMRWAIGQAKQRLRKE